MAPLAVVDEAEPMTSASAMTASQERADRLHESVEFPARVISELRRNWPGWKIYFVPDEGLGYAARPCLCGCSHFRTLKAARSDDLQAKLSRATVGAAWVQR